MASSETEHIAAALTSAGGALAEPKLIAARVIATVEAANVALLPIIGPRGVAALYQRSLHLARAAHAWLPPPAEGLQTTFDLAPLNTALSQQAGASAAAGGASLLQALYELLASLVGASLTERLLRPVWLDLLDNTHKQDDM